MLGPRLIRRFLTATAACLGLLLAGLSNAHARFEQEQLALESQIQQRIESLLSKTLSPNSYLVTVKVELDQRANPATVRQKTNTADPRNPFLAQDRFVLPGVPQKKEFTETLGAQTHETVVNTPDVESLIRKIAIKVLVAPDVTDEQVRGIRDLLSSSLPFNPLRGDEMDIQSSSLLVKTTPAGGASLGGSGFSRGTDAGTRALDRTTLIVIALLAVVALGLGVLLLFLLGPVRAFLNRLLTVLPRVGEQAAYAVNNNATNRPGAAITSGGGSLSNGNGAKDEREGPFSFIKEEQLVRLPLLLRQMPAPQAAIVFAYLPPEWASRVLAGLEPAQQSAVLKELSQAREVPAEAVKEVEAQVRLKLPYWVGGRDWLTSVYQQTDPNVQKMLLGSLNQQAPDLAKALRRTTFFFEDLSVLSSGGLRLLVQTAGFPIVAQALREEKPDFIQAVMQRLPPAMREILQQELDLPSNNRAGAADAKNRLVATAREMMADGRINFIDRKAS